MTRHLRSRISWILGFAAAITAGWAAPASGQQVVGRPQQIDFDRPESWAMKHFASAMLFTGMGTPQARDAGSVEFGFEVGWLPRLDENQRRVGFNGTKIEDLNKAPFLARPRVTIGLGAGFALDLSWIPPVEVFGVKSNLVFAAVERPLYSGPSWSFGARVYGQMGTAKSDFTCPADVAANPPGEDNPYGCEAPSKDEVTLDGFGVEVSAGTRLESLGDADLHVSAMTTRFDLEFQVDALTGGVRDRNLLLTDGWTYGATAGLTWPLGERGRIGAEVFWSPLDVRRPPGYGVSTDGLFNVRAIYRYTLKR